MLKFVKAHALGNDFILVEAGSVGGRDYSSLARRVCDRRMGIGADGLILWQQKADSFQLRIFNSDGSEAECSGNGLRCLGAHLFRLKPKYNNQIRLETVSGIYVLERKNGEFEADMGSPSLSPRDIPFLAPKGLERVIDFPLKVESIPLRITACAIPNPHCSVFVETIDSAMVDTLGPKLETHPAFPNRTNVEFIRVVNTREIEVAFWERGAGRTPASGTGSCGATVASVLNGKTERQVKVHTQHGTLKIDWNEKSNRLRLTATAYIIAEGQLVDS